MIDWLLEAGPSLARRLVMIVMMAVVAHVAALVVRRIGAALLGAGETGQGSTRRRPKTASVITLVVSTVTFTIYFLALGAILGRLGIPFTSYFASATVIGLAIGFGSQGLVQDIVIGLTLIFSDVLDVGDVADIGGQTGRVESIGLRFTVLRTLLDQRVFVPNRSVNQINRYRNGYVRAYVDIQLPEGADADALVEDVHALARSMHAQHGALILGEPTLIGPREAGDDGWSYLRLKFKLWPGQGALLETTFRQKALALLRSAAPDSAEWMVVVTWKASG